MFLFDIVIFNIVYKYNKINKFIFNLIFYYDKFDWILYMLTIDNIL